jgi:heme/copper-type cytochrome/quinol oxidase subunit 1
MIYAMTSIGILGFHCIRASYVYCRFRHRYERAHFYRSNYDYRKHGIKVFSWLATLWAGRITSKPQCYLPLVLFLFTIGGLTGLFYLMPIDISLHDTYVVARNWAE